MEALTEKVERLESLLGHFIVHTDTIMTRLERDIKSLRDEMSAFKNEMLAFKNEMLGFKDEARADRREMNKKWGELANKMGTIDEDLIAPAVRPVLSKYFDCEPGIRTIRYKKRVNGKEFEVDVLVVCENKVFMIEVKSSPRTEYVEQILDKSGLFREFCPEYNDKELIPIFAGVVFDENVIQHATQKGLYVMAYREWDYVDILNFDEIKNR